MLGVDGFIQPGERVLLKPNLIAPRPAADAVCTHPEVVRAVAMIIRDCGATPFIGDSPGYASLDRCLEKSGIREVVAALDIGVVSFERQVECRRPENHILKRFNLAAPVLEFDRVINLPKLKTHGMMGLTLAVKNLFGCIPGLSKAHWHMRAGHQRQLFARILLDLYQTIKPDLHILDGIVAMEGEGPTGGVPVSLGLLGAAVDGVALDYATEQLLDYPQLTPISQQAIDDNLLIPERIEVAGDFPEHRRPLKTARGSRDAAFPLHRLVRRLVVKNPVISSSRCHRCLVCVKHCPAQAMKFVDRSVRINYNTCIRCYCCHELCPYHAVRVRWGLAWAL